MTPHLCMLLITIVLVSQSVSEDIREPPSISVPPSDKIPGEYFKRDQPFELPCIATGIPNPSKTWLHNGKELDLNKANIKVLEDGILVDKTTALDAGEYQCVATNQWGKSLSQLFKVQLATIGDFSGGKEITPYRKALGKHLKVSKDEIQSVPDAMYTWRKVSSVNDDQPQNLQRTKRILQDLEGNLHFTSLKKADALEGVWFYKVDVFNTVVDVTKGGSYSRITVSAGADTNSPPSLIYPTSTIQEVKFLEGKEMRIQCIFSGNPDVDVTWEVPLRGIPEESNTILFVKEMSKNAEGEYTCTGTNTVGVATKSFTIKMETLPKFTEGGKPLKQTISEGDTAIFVCQMTPDTTPKAEIKFMINGEVITDAFPGRGTEIEQIENGKKMTITGLQRDFDIKVVQCRASNKHKTIYIDAPLNVLLRTDLTEKPATQTLEPATTQIVFNCTATSDPSTPPTITWTRDGKELDFYDDPLMVVHPNNPGQLTLHLSTLQGDQKAAYSGEYTCNATNTYTYKAHTAILTWNQGGSTDVPTTSTIPPRTTSKPDCNPDFKITLKPNGGHLVTRPGSSLVLTCTVTGLSIDKIPTITWYINERKAAEKSSRVFLYSTSHHMQKLYVFDLNVEDNGTYQCEVFFGSRTVKDDIGVTVFKDITFELAPLIQYPWLGSDAIIKCQVTGNPAPTIWWHYHNQRITSGGRYEYIPQGLKIYNITREDSGLYDCIGEVIQDGRVKNTLISVNVR